MTYAAIDIVFIIIIVVFMISAAVKGLIKEFFGKAAFIGGIIFAVIFTPKLELYVQSGIKNTTIAKVISFLLIFVIVFLIVKIIQEIISRIFSGEILRGLDRSLGLVFGIIEGIAVVAFILVLMEAQPWFNVDSLLKGSFFESVLNSIIKGPAEKIQGMAA